MFVPIAEAALCSLEKLLDDLVDMTIDLPEGETKRRLTQQILRLEEYLTEHAAP